MFAWLSPVLTSALDLQSGDRPIVRITESRQDVLHGPAHGSLHAAGRDVWTNVADFCARRVVSSR